jgi:murein L,D-transpeptidase YcbB/YkuD
MRRKCVKHSPRRIVPAVRAGLGAAVIATIGNIGCSNQFSPAFSSWTSATPSRSAMVVKSPPLRDLSAQVRAALEGIDHRSRIEQIELRRLYEPGGYAPLWVDASGVPKTIADDALRQFSQAEAEGLDSEDYDLTTLVRTAHALRSGSEPLSQRVVPFDVSLSAAMLRYCRHRHLGRVDPRSIGLRLTVPADLHDFPVLVANAIERGEIGELARALEPPLPQYRALRTTLARYRALETQGPIEAPDAPSQPVRPGQPYAGVTRLYRLLLLLGDLPPEVAAPTAGARYEGALVDATRRFQIRHGLEPDAVLGARTIAALRVPLAWRVRQIELALERLRWLPDLGNERLIVLNIPMFRLWAWDTSPADGTPTFGMDVIVGRALTTQTPIFVEQMGEVIFRPYWNVPTSILRNEVLPAIRRDPRYLQREDMEIVRGAGDDARIVEATRESIDGLAGGGLRIRQRPGAGNALGLIKFVFPNQENVYMHGTPARQLFSRSRRDFSHGCVRLADPVSLAEWALEERPEWNRSAILAAIEGSQSIHVRLPRPIQVILFYTTAAVMPEDGTVRFAEDIYRHDRRLDQVLAVRARATD